MDVTILLRRTRRIATRPGDRAGRIFFAAAVAAPLLAGCSKLPPQYDPVYLGGAAKREVLGWFGDEEPPPPIIEPPPAAGRPFPNLGTVPPPPLVTTAERAEREKQLAALQADRAAAAKADAALRARTGAGASAAAPSSQAPDSSQAPEAAGAPDAAQGEASGGAESEAAAAPSSPPPPPSESTAAAPAPVIELPSLPPTASSRGARSAAHLLTTSERRGSVSFGPDAADVSAAGLNTLDAAAFAALTGHGRVRLVPAQIDGAPASSALVERRQKSLRDALAAAGMPDDRLTIADAGGRRVDVYDVYVDY